MHCVSLKNNNTNNIIICPVVLGSKKNNLNESVCMIICVWSKKEKKRKKNIYIYKHEFDLLSILLLVFMGTFKYGFSTQNLYVVTYFLLFCFDTTNPNSTCISGLGAFYSPSFFTPSEAQTRLITELLAVTKCEHPKLAGKETSRHCLELWSVFCGNIWTHSAEHNLFNS